MFIHEQSQSLQTFACIILNTIEVNEGPVPRKRKILHYVRRIGLHTKVFLLYTLLSDCPNKLKMKPGRFMIPSNM